MPTNLLLLPLLGGFWFVHFCYLFKFRAQRLDGYRLLLESAFFGLLLILPARLIAYFWPRFSALGSGAEGEWITLWHGPPLSGTASLSLLLGLISPFLVNWLHAAYLRTLSSQDWDPEEGASGLWEAASNFLAPAREKALDFAIRNSGNQFFQLLHRAAVHKIPVLLTLQNRKVYVGHLTESPNLKPENQFVSLLPALSGHRDDKTLAIKFDVIYDLEGLIAKLDIEAEELLLTIPLSEIKSTSLYHSGSEEFALPYNLPAPALEEP